MGLEGVLWANSPLDEYIQSISSSPVVPNSSPSHLLPFFPPSSSLSAELRVQKESSSQTSTFKSSSSDYGPLPYAATLSCPVSSRLPDFSEHFYHHKYDKDDGVDKKKMLIASSNYLHCNRNTLSTFSSYPSSSFSSYYYYHDDPYDTQQQQHEASASKTPISPLWREDVLYPFRLCQPIFGSQRLSKFLSFLTTSTLQIVWGSLCLQCQAVAVSAGILESSASSFDGDNYSDRRKRRWRRRREEEEGPAPTTAADEVVMTNKEEGEEEGESMSKNRKWRRRRVWVAWRGGRKGRSIILFFSLLFLFGWFVWFWWWEGGESGKEEGAEEGEGNGGVCVASLKRMMMWGKRSEAAAERHLLSQKWVSLSSVCAAFGGTKELLWETVGKYYDLIGLENLGHNKLWWILWMIRGMLITITKMMVRLLMMTIFSFGKGLGYIAVGGMIILGIFLVGVFVWHILFLSRFHRFVEMLVSGWRVSKQCLRWIQEVELMQRGFRLSEPLAPISRIEQSDRWRREKHTFFRLLPSTINETKISGSSDSKSNSNNNHSCNSSNGITTDMSKGSSNYITVNNNRSDSSSSSNKSSGSLHSCRTSTSSSIPCEFNVVTLHLRIAVFRFLESMQILFSQHSQYIENCIATGCAFSPPPFLPPPPPSFSSPVLVEQEEKDETMKRGEDYNNNNNNDNISIVELKRLMTSLWRSQTSYCGSLQSCLLGSVGSTFYVRQQFEHFPPSPSSPSIITLSKQTVNGSSEDFSSDFFTSPSRALQAEHCHEKGGGPGGGGSSWLIYFSYYFHYLAGSCCVVFSLAKEFGRSLRLGALYTFIIYRSLHELLTCLEAHLEILRFQLLSEWTSVGHVDVVEDFSASSIGDARNVKSGWNERTTIDPAREATPSSPNSNSGSSSSSDNNIGITNCNSSKSIVPCRRNKKSWWLRWCLVRWLAISPSSPVVMLTEVGGLQKPPPRSLRRFYLMDKKEKRGKGIEGEDNEDEDEDNNDGRYDFSLEEERHRKTTMAALASMAASLRREWSSLNVSIATALVTLRLRSQLLPSRYWRRSSEDVSIFKRTNNNSHNNYSYNDKTIPSITTTTTTTGVIGVVKELCGRRGILPVLLEKFIKMSCCLVSSLFSYSFFSSPFPWASLWMMSGGSTAKVDSSSIRRSRTHCPSILSAQSLRVRQTELKEMEAMLESVRVPLGNALEQCQQLRQTLEQQKSNVAALQNLMEGEGDILNMSGKDGKGNKEGGGGREDEETKGGRGKKLLMDVSGRMSGKKKSEESCFLSEKEEESKKNGKYLEIYCAVGCPHEMKSRRRKRGGKEEEEWEKEAEEDDEGEERRRAQKIKEEGKKTVEELKSVLGSYDRYSYQMNLDLWDEEEKSHRGGDENEGQWRLEEERLEERRGGSQKNRPRLRREDVIVVRGITEDEFGRQVISERHCMRNACSSNNYDSSINSSSSHNNSSGSCSRRGDSSGTCSSSGGSSGICSSRSSGDGSGIYSSSSGDNSGICSSSGDSSGSCSNSRGDNSGSCSSSGDNSGSCSSSGDNSGSCSSSGGSSGIVKNIFVSDSICGQSSGGGGDSRDGRDYSQSEGEEEEVGSSSAFGFGTASSNSAAVVDVLSELQCALEMRRRHAKENF